MNELREKAIEQIANRKAKREQAVENGAATFRKYSRHVEPSPPPPPEQPTPQRPGRVQLPSVVPQYPGRKKNSAEEADGSFLAVEDRHCCDTATDRAQQRSNSCYADRCDAIFEGSADDHFWFDQSENDQPFSIVRYQPPAPPSLHELPDDDEILTVACSPNGTAPTPIETFPEARHQTTAPTTQPRSRVSSRRRPSSELKALAPGDWDRTGHPTVARTVLRNLSWGSPKPPKQLPRKTVKNGKAAETLSTAEREGKSKRFSFIFFLVCLLISGFCFYQGITSDTYQQATKPIQEIALGDRVAGTNPHLSDEERNIADPDPSTWRAFTLRMDKPDGDQLTIKLLCPPEWSELHSASPGDTVQLDLEELGASGPARVIAADPSPPIRPGPGQVVTGLFIHSSADAVDLHLEGGETLGVTPNHPMWSDDRQDFVPAVSLAIGEQLLARDGRRVRITDITPRAGPEPVYNLQVHGEHVYQVGSDGLLVHNKATRSAHSASLFAQLKATLRLQQTLSRGKIKTIDRLTPGTERAAVFDVSTGRIHVGNAIDGTHIGVVRSHNLPVMNDRFVGGFLRVADDGSAYFITHSATFPYTNPALPANVLDLIRGTGVSVIVF